MVCCVCYFDCVGRQFLYGVGDSMIKLQAWAVRHNAHGFHVSDLFWCKEGEGPGDDPGWHRPEQMMRMPQFDTEVPPCSDKGSW